MAARALRILPVGGLDEVGRNMTAISWGEETLVVDCGVGFPEGDARGTGIEQLLPDLTPVAGRPIAAVLLTHGHDDHVSALAHLIRSGTPIGRIVGLPFTIALVRAKLAAHEVPVPRTLVAMPGQEITTGAFTAEWVRMAHSIPDAAAIALHTPVGLVVLSGDYKLDATQANPRRRADLKRLAALGRDGVHLLLGDSTNAQLAGRTGGEDTTAAPLAEVVEQAPGRVIVTSFASNIDRVDHAFRAADRSGRQVSILGRSMRRNVELAEQLDELDLPARPTAGPRDLAGLRPRRSLVVCTGSQGEEFAVLARAARGEHPNLHLNGADTVVFASRPVPGNEGVVRELRDTLRARGCRIVTHEDAPIHVSGHARADEIEELYGLLRPRFTMPVHGEREMLEAQARIAVARAGLDREQVILARNGDVVEVVEDGVAIVDHVPLETVLADADGIPLAQV